MFCWGSQTGANEDAMRDKISFRYNLKNEAICKGAYSQKQPFLALLLSFQEFPLLC